MADNKEFFQKRIERVRKMMEERGQELLFLTPSSYMKYLTGYAVRGDERFLTFILSRQGGAFALGNELYRQQMEGIPADAFYFWSDGEDPFLLVEQLLREQGIFPKTAAVDPNMPARFLVRLGELFPQSRISDGASLMDPLRVYKDEAERRSMIKACRKADEALRAALGDGKEWLGRTEEEFLARLVYEMSRRGIQNGAACVCAGANAAEPHHCPGQSRIEKGMSLLVDFGGDYENYNTDMTRNFFFGTPGQEYLKLYRILQEALALGKLAAVAGNCLQDVDRAVRGHIAAQGYGQYFTHRTGHGIGIDCHEGPSVQEGETTRIRPGMTFSIEPGIYIPGKLGIRLEDQMMVTEVGTKALHNYPLDLVVIDC